MSIPVGKISLNSGVNSTAQRLLLFLLGAAAFIVTADVRVVNPLLPIIASEFKTDIGSVGFIVTAYTIPYGLFQLFYGPLGDRIGKLRVITVCMALFAFGTAACALAPNLLLLDVLRFLTGTFAAALIPLSIAYIGDHVTYEERQPALAKYMSAVALGQILSTSLGGIVGDYLSWRYIFLLYGFISIGVWVALWRATRRIPDTQGTGGLFSFSALKPYYQIMRESRPRLVIIAVFIEGIFFFGGFTYLGAFLRDQYHLLYIAIGFILSGFGLGSLIYTRSVRWLVRTLRESGLILLGGLLVLLCYLSIALLKSWLLFIPLNILLGTSFYMLHNTLQTKATEMAPRARGTAVSLFAFSLFIGQGIGAAVLGIVVDGPGYTPTFVIAGIMTALLAIWFVAFVRKDDQQAKPFDEQGVQEEEIVTFVE